MLPEESPEANYFAPVWSPWQIKLDPEPSAEEGLFLNYVRDAIEHEREPVSISIEGEPEFAAGAPMPLQLTVSNHMTVPLTMFERDEGAQPPSELRFGLYVCSAETGECFDEAPLLASEVMIPPNESMMIELNLDQLYGIQKLGTYRVYQFIDMPVAPGRNLREGGGYSPSFYLATFTVIPEDDGTAVSARVIHGELEKQLYLGASRV